MAKLISLKIDVTKISKEKLFKGAKGNYLDLVVALNDEPDKFGNNVSCWESQKQEEKTDPKNYLGNGKVFWEKPSSGSSNNSISSNTSKPEVNDDLPF